MDGFTVGCANIYVSFSASRFDDGFTGAEDGSDAS